MPMQIKNAFENLSISTFIRQSTWLSGCLHSPTPHLYLPYCDQTQTRYWKQEISFWSCTPCSHSSGHLVKCYVHSYQLRPSGHSRLTISAGVLWTEGPWSLTYLNPPPPPISAFCQKFSPHFQITTSIHSRVINLLIPGFITHLNIKSINSISEYHTHSKIEWFFKANYNSCNVKTLERKCYVTVTQKHWWSSRLPVCAFPHWGHMTSRNTEK